MTCPVGTCGGIASWYPNILLIRKVYVYYAPQNRRLFVFAEGRYLRGAYRYPVPQELRARIKAERDFPVRISDELCKTLTERLAKNLIEDEFEDLRAFQKDEESALLATIDPKLSEREQKEALAQALRRAEAGHPAVDNYEGSRCYIVTHNNLRRAYEQAGLQW